MNLSHSIYAKKSYFSFWPLLPKSSDGDKKDEMVCIIHFEKKSLHYLFFSHEKKHIILVGPSLSHMLSILSYFHEYYIP